MMKNKLKFFGVFLGCLAFRLLPLRAPNVEPIMASIMPLGRKYGALTGFVFGFSSILLYDVLTHFGSWTWIGAITYGVIGALAPLYFTRFNNSNSPILNFAMFSFFATIFFDLVTGVLFAPLWAQNMGSALILQIPFTLLHLAGNIGFAVTLSPLIDKWLASEHSLLPRGESSLWGVKA